MATRLCVFECLLSVQWLAVALIKPGLMANIPEPTCQSIHLVTGAQPVSLTPATSLTVGGDGTAFCWSIRPPPGQRMRASFLFVENYPGEVRFDAADPGSPTEDPLAPGTRNPNAMYASSEQLHMTVFLPANSNATFSIDLTSISRDSPILCGPLEHLCERGAAFCVNEDISCLCLWNPAADCGVESQFNACRAVALENDTTISETGQVFGLLRQWEDYIPGDAACWFITGPWGLRIEVTFTRPVDRFHVVVLQPELFDTLFPVLDTDTVPNTIMSFRSSVAVLIGPGSDKTTGVEFQLSVEVIDNQDNPCKSDEFLCPASLYAICFAEEVQCDNLRSYNSTGLYGCGSFSVHLNETQWYVVEFPLDDQGPPWVSESAGTQGTNCTWWLYAKPGQIIKVDFNRFDPYIARANVELEVGVLDGGGAGTVVATYGKIREASRALNASRAWIRLRADDQTMLQLNLTAVDPVPCNGSAEFLCRSGIECISRAKACDGLPDCADKSDEFGCGRCSREEMHCGDFIGTCVPGSAICNAKEDCLNLYDELDCGFCGLSMFHLRPKAPLYLRAPVIVPNTNAATCVWLLQASDPGHRILIRALEYVTESLSKLAIGTGHDPMSLLGTEIVRKDKGVFPAGSLVATADKAWVKFTILGSRGDNKVNNFVFELTEVNHTVECREDEFPCSHGLQCVPLAARCNFLRDCDDFSDELGCGECPSSKYHCGYGECVEHRDICDFNVAQCSNTMDEFDCFSVCGPSFINLTSEAEVTVRLTVPAFYHYFCGWLVASDPGTVIYVNVIAVDQEDLHYLSVEDDSLTDAPWLESYANLAGTSFFTRGNEAMIRSMTLRDTSRAASLELNIRVHETSGACGINQTLLAEHNACLSMQALCDGKASWLDFSDEMSCDTCGGFSIELYADYAVFLVAEFDSESGQGAFEIHRSNRSDPLPTQRLPAAEAVGRAELPARFDCLWRVTAPAGTRLEAVVRTFSHNGQGLSLKFDDGEAALPTAESLLVVRHETAVPAKLYFNGSSLWVQLINEGVDFLEQMEVVLTAHMINDCGDGHFQCLSTLACIDIAYRCDGISNCLQHEDELGCGQCAVNQFECIPGGKCVLQRYICDGLNDCGAFNDEYGCYSDADSRVNLTHNASAYSLDHRGIHDDSAWEVVSPAETRIRVTVMYPTSCTLIFGEGPYSRYVNSTDGFRTVSPSTSNWTYPHTVTSNGPRLWVLVEDCYYPLINMGFWLQFEAFLEKDCPIGSWACKSGATCVELSARCDGRIDCPEHEDEVGCGACGEGEFSCPVGGECLPLNSICNGRLDCEDGTDENGCGPCGDTFFNLTDTSPVTLTSPAWPNYYPDGVQCTYLLQAELGLRVMITFLTFDTELGYDKLLMGNGLDPTGDVILEHSGNMSPSRVASKYHTMYMLFSSHALFTHQGFELRAEQLPQDQVSCKTGETACDYKDFICVGEKAGEVCPDLDCDSDAVTFLGDEVHVKSPNYPKPYPAGLYCKWAVQPTRGTGPGTVVQVLAFSTEVGEDVARLTGLNFHGEELTFALAGTTKIHSILFNSSVEVTVRFQTDSNIQLTGYHIRFSNVDFNGSTDWCTNNQTEFLCEDGACLAASAECDGFQDCLKGEDESFCDEVYCPSSYLCSGTRSCILPQSVCDGTIDCEQGDDEVKCDEKRCPENCSCEYINDDFHVLCTKGWESDHVKDIARITAALQLTGATNQSSIQLVPGLFKELKCLNSLSLPYNMLYFIPPGTFYGLGNLSYLNISGNELTEIESETFAELHSLEALIITDVPALRSIAENAFAGLVKLKTLVLVRDAVEDVPFDVKPGAFASLPASAKFVVDDYRLCCDFLRDIRDFEISSCQTTQAQPPLNLCGSLMQNDGLRACMWVLAISAVFGNLAVIVWRLRHCEGNSAKKTHSFLVVNLAVSDFIMGVYMLIIAAADIHFGESYSKLAAGWRASVGCKIAGILSVLSSEASVFFVTLISLNCLLCVVFPFSKFRIREESARVVALVAWVVTLCLSVVPTLVVDSNSDVYGLSDVCIGLPLTTKAAGVRLEPSDIDNPFGDDEALQIVSSTGRKPAWILSIVLFLGVNLTCFLVVLVCYVAIFFKVKRSVRKVKRNSHRDREIRMAVKMALIVGTDFVCWMPVILLGILSQTGAVHVGAEVFSWIVVLVLPINSSLNPYLYTIFSSVMAQRSVKSSSEKPPTKPSKQKSGSVETVNSHLSG